MSVDIARLIKEYFTPQKHLPQKHHQAPPEIQNMAFLSQLEFEEWEERAAIMEFNGELPRAEAEKVAWARVLRRRERGFFK